MMSRAAPSTALPAAPARAASMPAFWARSTVSYTWRISFVTDPTATVRVMSEQ